MTALYILIGLGVLIALYVIVTYNGLVSLKNRVAEAWSDIEVQMKVRYNLIPNLVETVKGYMGHERETLESVTRARGEAMANQGSPDAQARSENMLAG
ncbi:MAG: LemA family protein, partial [Proteobacteria bacterium]|nr:LemA family protein [Pseudomonadota bacterium]